MKKGETFQKEKKGKERSGNISEGETERKGAETFRKEKWKGKERKHFTEKKEGKKIRRKKEEKRTRKRKGEKSLWGVS